MHEWLCSWCKQFGIGDWYFSDYAEFAFFVCYGDCQDHVEELDLAIVNTS